ncbi:MAG: nitroreductase family protein [Lachnospiraceae bacterium]|nr:nitroreductase family protein [Lachnospiraceae bacterium]
MEFKELIKVRRSTRDYDKDKKVTKEQLEKVIALAQMAPTWKNSQNARYYCVIGDRLEAFREKALPSFNQKNSAGAALVVTTYVKGLAGYGPNGPADDIEAVWGGYDLGLQNAYFVLAAKEEGLDTLIMGLSDTDYIRQELAIPEDEVIAAVIAVGYRASEPKLGGRKDLSEIAKFF